MQSYHDIIPFTYTINGEDLTYFILEDETSFTIQQDGRIIARVEYQDDWIQSDGVPLSDDFIDAVGTHIDSYYN